MKAEFISCVLGMALFAFATGCGQASHSASVPHEKPGADSASDARAAASDSPSHEHSHEGWWCDEHGVPEEVCALCNAKVAAEFQKKGDWCKEHDRPESQCFLCHPELEGKFAAKYEAKVGSKPPKPQR